MPSHIANKENSKGKDIDLLTSCRQPTSSPIHHRTGFLLTAISVMAPYFIIKIPNTSFYVVDFVLVLGVFIFFLSATLKQGDLFGFSRRKPALIILGFLFIIASLLSGIEGLIFGSGGFSISAFLSGLSQYAFVMLVLPLLAGWLISLYSLWGFFRAIGLGYLPPMLLTLILMHPSAPATLREYFFIAGRATGTFGNANAFAGVLAIMIPVYTALAISDRGIWKLLGASGVVLSLICLLLTASFGGALIFFLLIIVNLVMVFIWPKYPTRQYKKETLGLAIFIVLVMGGSVGPLLGSQWSSGQISNRISLLTKVSDQLDPLNDLGSVSLRVDLILEAIDLIGDRWGGVWGHGLRQSTRVSSFSYEVHVLYLLLWIEGGVFLLFLFFLFFSVMIRNVFRLADLDPLAATTVGSGILALLFFGLINPHIYLRFYWVPLLPAFVDWHGYHAQAST